MLWFTKKFMHLGRRGAEEHPSHPTIPSLPSLRAAPAHAFAAASPVAMATPTAHLICSALLRSQSMRANASRFVSVSVAARCVFQRLHCWPLPFSFRDHVYQQARQWSGLALAWELQTRSKSLPGIYKW